MYLGRFHILDCPVPLILGMEFLTKVKPTIDFENKSVAVTHCGVQHVLLTCIIGKDGQITDVTKVVSDESSKLDDLSMSVNDQ